ncbi:MAG TPA: Ig-like domain-containing protein [Turneriella sp.]|nr:Ig-like domain-containing protein [Turneriella sp.]
MNRYVLYSLLSFTACQIDLEREIQQDIDTTQPTVQSSIPQDENVRRLTTLELTFSETIKGGTEVGAYTLAGGGVGTLVITAVDTNSSNARTLHFTGVPHDGTLTLSIAGVTDHVGNPLQNNVLTWQGDGLPKWHYLGRKLSRGFIASNQIRIGSLGDEVVLVYSDEECRANYGFHNLTALAFNVKTKVARALGQACIVGGDTAEPLASNILIIDNKIYFAILDTSTTDKKATVLTFNGSAWVAVGSERFTPAAQTGSSQLSYIDGFLYLTYRDGATSNYLRVYRKNLSTDDDWIYLDVLPMTDTNPFAAQKLKKYGNQLFVGVRDTACKAPSVRYYDFGSNSYSTKIKLESTSSNTSCDEVQMLESANTPLLAFSIRLNASTRAIRFLKWDTLGWADTNWQEEYATYDTGSTSALNYLDCQLRGTQPFCNYVEGAGFNYTLTYTVVDGWQHVKSPTETKSAINGGHPGFLVLNDVIYLAVRDKDVGYSDTLSLLSYE